MRYCLSHKSYKTYLIKKVKVTHLDEVVCVVGAVDTDGVFERGAVGRGKQQQFEALGCGHAEGLSDQSEASELLGEYAARLGLQLAVKRLGHRLLAKQQYVLTRTRKWVRAQFIQRSAGQGRARQGSAGQVS